MKKILTIIICLCIIASFTACHNINVNGIGDLDQTHKISVKYGSYKISDIYIVSTGQHIYNEYTQTEYVYLENDNLQWYVQSGALWTCRNYSYTINGNENCCTPIYNNGLVDIEFNYNENNNEITFESNDIIFVFSYNSNNKPVDHVYKNL